jgi:hypothetical protein
MAIPEVYVEVISFLKENQKFDIDTVEKKTS